MENGIITIITMTQVESLAMKRKAKKIVKEKTNEKK
jgi:hypothetical protein